MKKTKQVRKHALWYASHMYEEQGEALIMCMIERIKEDDRLIENVLSEIELAENPKEYSAEMILQSIKELISARKKVVVNKDIFEWTA